MSNWQLIEHDGKLGITLGWSPDNDTPKETRRVWVSTVKWDEWYFGQYTQVRLISNNHFRCFSSRTYSESYLDITGWKQMYQEREIKPPGRGGKDWKWAWHWGKWHKEWK